MWGSNHHNRDVARAGGLDDIIFNTRGYEMIFEIMFRRWMGLDGWLTKLGPFRMGKSSHPGDLSPDVEHLRWFDLPAGSLAG